MKAVQKIIGLYFFIGAIATYILYLSIQTTGHIFSFFIPNFIATIVFIAYASISYLFFKEPQSNKNENAFMIMLLIQSFQIELFGYGFSNFYFPELSIHFNLKELSEISLEYDYFSANVLNGYFRNNTNNSISINIALLLLLFFIPYFSKKNKEKKELILIDSDQV